MSFKSTPGKARTRTLPRTIAEDDLRGGLDILAAWIAEVGEGAGHLLVYDVQQACTLIR